MRNEERARGMEGRGKEGREGKDETSIKNRGRKVRRVEKRMRKRIK